MVFTDIHKRYIWPRLILASFIMTLIGAFVIYVAILAAPSIGVKAVGVFTIASYILAFSVSVLIAFKGFNLVRIDTLNAKCTGS